MRDREPRKPDNSGILVGLPISKQPHKDAFSILLPSEQECRVSFLHAECMFLHADIMVLLFYSVAGDSLLSADFSERSVTPEI